MKTTTSTHPCNFPSLRHDHSYCLWFLSWRRYANRAVGRTCEDATHSMFNACQLWSVPNFTWLQFNTDYQLHISLNINGPQKKRQTSKIVFWNKLTVVPKQCTKTNFVITEVQYQVFLIAIRHTHTHTRGQNDGAHRTSRASNTLLQPQTHDSNQSCHLFKHICITRVSLPTI